MRGAAGGRAPARVNDYFAIRLLRGVLNAAMILGVLMLVLSLFWVLVLGASTSPEPLDPGQRTVPSSFWIVGLICVGLVSGCHHLMRWLKKALR